MSKRVIQTPATLGVVVVALWVVNVLAEGAAVIVNEGETYHVDHPELVSGKDAMPEIPAKYQWSLRLYDVDQFLRVQTVVR